MKTKYTYKQIWTIAYPILISLIMEQMIGMTDTGKGTTRKSGRFSIRASIFFWLLPQSYLHFRLSFHRLS